MIRFICLALITAATIACSNNQQTAQSSISKNWEADKLLKGYEARSIEPLNDSRNEFATLVRKLSAIKSQNGVLYIHGYNDYFFQSEMGDRLADSMYNFYAVDLRLYGRSMVDGEKPFQIESLDEYFEEINSAIEIMHKEGTENIVLMGHSTGGLIASLYAKKNQNSLRIDALILNSPFLDMNMSKMMESVGIPAVAAIGSIFPKLEFPDGDVSYYGQSIHKAYYGEWDFDTLKKFMTPQTVTARWLHAIHTGHKNIQKGAEIPCPILLLRSDKSVGGTAYSEVFETGDAVLDIEDISRYGNRLGKNIEEVVIENGLHDLALSKRAVRERFYGAIFGFLERGGVDNS